MTKEAVAALWDVEAKAVIAALKITGGTSDKGWNQRVCGVINVRTFFKILAMKLDKEAQNAALVEAATIGSNSSQQGQRLFSSKVAKSTAIATELGKLIG